MKYLQERVDDDDKVIICLEQGQVDMIKYRLSARTKEHHEYGGQAENNYQNPQRSISVHHGCSKFFKKRK